MAAVPAWGTGRFLPGRNHRPQVTAPPACHFGRPALGHPVATCGVPGDDGEGSASLRHGRDCGEPSRPAGAPGEQVSLFTPLTHAHAYTRTRAARGGIRVKG